MRRTSRGSSMVAKWSSSALRRDLCGERPWATDMGGSESGLPHRISPTSRCHPVKHEFVALDIARLRLLCPQTSVAWARTVVNSEETDHEDRTYRGSALRRRL